MASLCGKFGFETLGPFYAANRALGLLSVRETGNKVETGEFAITVGATREAKDKTIIRLEYLFFALDVWAFHRFLEEQYLRVFFWGGEGGLSSPTTNFIHVAYA